MHKDYLKRIIAMMEYLVKHPEQISESKMQEIFGHRSWRLFSQYAMNSDASTNGQAYAVECGGTIRLTQLGIRKVFELRGIIADEKRADAIKWATIILALIAAFELIKELI